MSRFSGASGIAITSALGVAVVGAILWYQKSETLELEGVLQQDTPAAAVVSDPIDDAVETAGLSETVSTVEDEPATPPSEPAQPVAVPGPAFDEVRREEDGMTVIAGRAAPGAEIQILLDGVEIVKTSSDGNGKFAALAFITPDGAGHILTLSQLFEGERMDSDDQIILAPINVPVVVAQAEPEVETPAVVQEAQTDDAAEPVQVAQDPETEAPAEPVAEAPAAQVVEAPAVQVAEAPAEPVAEAPAAQVAEAPAAQVAEAPAVQVAEAPAEQVAEAQVAAAPAAQVAAAPAAQVAAAPAAQVVEAPAAQVAEAPAEPVAAAPAAQVAEAPAEPVVEAPTAQVAEAPVEPVVEAPTAQVAEAPTAQGGVASAPVVVAVADTMEAEPESKSQVVSENEAPEAPIELVQNDPPTNTGAAGSSAKVETAETTQNMSTQAASLDPVQIEKAPLQEQNNQEGTFPATVVADSVPQPVEEPIAKIAESVPQELQQSDLQEVSEPIAADSAASVVTQQATETAQSETAQSATQTPAQAPEQTKEEVVMLKTTSAGVELINAKPPEVMDNVELDTISYSDAGDVQLSGRAQSNTQAVRVYLDNNAIVSLPVDDAGRWRGDLPDVDEGIYTLRVDEVAADGSVTSRVETPFKRESPDVLARAAGDQDGPLKKITVQKGATLWAIARDRYGDGLLYVKVFKANQGDIRDPDLIYPGQIFDLPGQ